LLTCQTIAILVGVAALIVEGSRAGYMHGLARGNQVSLAFGLALQFFSYPVRTEPAVYLLRLRLSVRLLRTTAVTMFAFLGIGLLLARWFGFGQVIIMGVLGLLFGLWMGLLAFVVPAGATKAATPISVLRASRSFGWQTPIVAVGYAGLVTGLTTALAYGPAVGLVYGGLFAVCYGIGERMSGISANAWFRFCVSRAWLAFRGVLPWRLMTFLEEGVSVGLLRRSGTSYQFRHARFADWLAAQPGGG
jgi:hypothetical protein